MTPLRRILSDEGHARTDAIFAGIVCGLAIVLVAIMVLLGVHR